MNANKSDMEVVSLCRIKNLSRMLLAFGLMMALFLGGMPRAWAQDSWVVYLYMCGSDLETNSSFATENLQDLRKVALPENVKFVVQTGGAEKWHMAGVPSDAIARYVLDNQGWHQVEKLPDASMGVSSTLEGFLRFAKENYPAEHRMLLFWDHGGGSIDGVCSDERDEKILQLADIKRALTAVEKNDVNKPAFDVVCFDTCLMATLETANVFQGYAKYMVASQELMPGTGTDYTSWAGKVAQNPAIDALSLSKEICDSFMARCEKFDVHEKATLSVLDMSKLPAVNAAYERMGQEALQQVKSSPVYFFAGFNRVAREVENYGPNSSVEEQWTNMVDLGTLAAGMTELPSAADVARAVDAAVVYRVAGPYRQYGKGLSCYYNLDGQQETVAKYTHLPQVSNSFASVYSQMVATGSNGKPLYAFDLSKVADIPITWDGNNVAVVQVPPQDANGISSVNCYLVQNLPDGKLYYLGNDAKVQADWAGGVFKAGFDGLWPGLNGHIIYMSMDESRAGYNLYNSLILINGEKYSLHSAFNHAEGKFEILGAYKVSKDGFLDREIRMLKQGDKITPLFLDSNAKIVKGETFTLTAEPQLADVALPDGRYEYYFNFSAPQNDDVLSDPVVYTVTGGQIQVEKS